MPKAIIELIPAPGTTQDQVDDALFSLEMVLSEAMGNSFIKDFDCIKTYTIRIEEQ